MPTSKQVFSFLRTNPVFLILLPVFFVLHGYVANFPSITIEDAGLLTLLLIACAVTLAGILWFYFRSVIKSALTAGALTGYDLFFGKIQDLLKSISAVPLIGQYRFVLPVSFLMLLAIILALKRSHRPFIKLCAYLNILLIALVVIDSSSLIRKVLQPVAAPLLHPGSVMLHTCDQCPKPDIYLVLVDQYAGNAALKDVFRFDNTAFTDQLKQRGFHVAARSSSNYNLTPFSMASLLNMDYLTNELGVKKHLNVSYSYQLIKNSEVVRFLDSSGYEFYNYSVFDFPGHPAHKYRAFLPYGTKLITSQTLTGRLERDIRAGIIEGTLGSTATQQKIIYENLHFNDSIFSLTKNIAAKKTGQPKFVYSHLMIPHHPYYFDSKGDSMPLKKLLLFSNTDSRDYIEYLQYGNKRILELVDAIVATSPAPPVIMLLSDHGFRHPSKTIDRHYDFMNLNAVLLPQKNYSGFTDSLTNVNQFRVFFNSSFDQHLPLLKDSTVDLWD